MAQLKTLSVTGAATGGQAPAGPTEFVRKQDQQGYVAVPATPTSAGVAGSYAADAYYEYFCPSTNAWIRAAAATGWSSATLPAVGKLMLMKGAAGGWNESVLTVTNNSLLGFDGSGNGIFRPATTVGLALLSAVDAPTGLSTLGGAPLASPGFTGVPTAPTASPGTNTTQLGTTAFVAAAVAPLAPLASPGFTGTPTAPTAGSGNNTTQLATTAFVKAAVDTAVGTLFVNKGPLDCSANPNYPAANVNDVYRVSVAGKIGGASGVVVEVGDMIFCDVTNGGGSQASVGADFHVEQANIAGMTTVGNAIITLANPGAVTYLRINADNTVTARTAAQMLSDLGAQATLTAGAGVTLTGSTLSVNGFSSHAYTTPTDTTLTPSNGDYTYRITISGSASGNGIRISLDTTGRAAGDKCGIPASFAADASRLRVFNSTTGGTVLLDQTNDSVARKFKALFVFNGTSWELDSGGYYA